jgi:hypothetical protein
VPQDVSAAMTTFDVLAPLPRTSSTGRMPNSKPEREPVSMSAIASWMASRISLQQSTCGAAYRSGSVLSPINCSSGDADTSRSLAVTWASSDAARLQYSSQSGRAFRLGS